MIIESFFPFLDDPFIDGTLGSGTPGPIYQKIRAAFADAAVDLGTPV